MTTGSVSNDPTKPRVSVVVVTYRSSEHIQECLDSLLAQSRPADRVCVVANDSEDQQSTLAILAGHPILPVVHPQKWNTGFAAGANTGIADAQSASMDFVALLNPDATVDSRWLEALCDAAVSHPGFSAFASAMFLKDHPDRVDGFGDAYHISGFVWRRHHGQKCRESWLRARKVFSPCGGAALLRLDDVLAVGGFDEELFCYMEDVDLGFRLKLADKHTLFVPGAVAHHQVSGSTGYRSEISTYYGVRNVLWVLLKNMPSPLLPAAVLCNAIAQILYLCRSLARGQFVTVLRAQRDSLSRTRKALEKRRTVQQTRAVTAKLILEDLDLRLLPWGR